MISAIVFDVDDTLYLQVTPFKTAVIKAYPAFPEAQINALFLRFRHHSDLHFSKTTTGEWSLEKMRRQRITQALADFHFETSEETADHFQDSYETALQDIALPPEMKEILVALQNKKMPLAVITNGPSQHQQKKIDALQLTQFIPEAAIFISGAVGISKPAPEIFKLAEKKLKLPAETILYIGDSYDNDVVGAKKAGWQVWWFNHQQRALSNTQQPIFDAEILSYAELAKKITLEA